MTNVNRQSNLLIAFLLVLVTCVIVSTFYFYPKFLHSPAAYPASQNTQVIRATWIITGIGFFVTQVLLFAFSYAYKKKLKGRAAFLSGNPKLEILWTFLPAITFIFLFICGEQAWERTIHQKVESNLKIEVLAEQFAWLPHYPGRDNISGRTSFRFISDENPLGLDPADSAGFDDFIPVQIHLPVNQSVEIVLRSRDVIHSFFVPGFRAKMDALPGMVTRLQLTPAVTTEKMRVRLRDPGYNFEVACAELCGRMHYAMKQIIVVDEPEAYEKWVNNQQSGHQNRRR